MTLGSRSLISHHGWMLSQITYIGSTAELARKHLMWGTCESLLSKATWKTTHASISGSAGSSTQAIRSFFVNPQGVSSWSSETSGSTLPSTSHTSLDTTVVTGDVIRAEVLWTLKVVMCHYSFNSCNDISATFRAMFPDSGIVKTFTCGASLRISDMLWTCSIFPWAAGGYGTKYSMVFDECMNRISQNEQMDFIIRYWDGNTNKVAVWYLGSSF